eukprot:jgi/Phyca11/7352/fgenesh1_pm.PHYCAscaffold_19_\
MASPGGLRWKVSPADDEDGSASSISDVFADMLNVNEDMIVAAAESQAEGDVDGLIAYQRILHRDLMEMAEFIDSMRKVREIQRSKEQWIKSRHQVLEEEGVSAIMNDNSSGMLEASKENAATTSMPPTAPMNLLLANQLALSASAPALTLPAPIPPTPMTTATSGQQIKPSSVGSNPKIALPPAHSMFNMLFAFPGAPPLMLNSPAVGGVMPMQWQPQLQTPLPVRSVVPARPPDPEWQPAEQPPTARRRRRKQPVGNTTKQVT